MNSSFRIYLLCVIFGMIAFSRAEIDPIASDELSSSSELYENSEARTTAADWHRLVKSMCMSLIITNDHWLSSVDPTLYRKCLEYALESNPSSSNRQRRFFQISVGKGGLKGENVADSKGFKYGRK